MKHTQFSFLSVALLFAINPAATIAAETGDVQEIFTKFSSAWDDEAWTPEGTSRWSLFMREADDAGWKARMHALHALANAAAEAADEVGQVLKNGDTPERILAAQALGFMGSQSCNDALAHAAEHDDDAAVRLYAVQSLRLLGAEGFESLFKTLAETEENRDVQRHLAYAMAENEADANPGATAAQTLVAWDVDHLDSAKIGAPAPEIALPSLTDEVVRLSDYRGKKKVALVFVYGDT